MRRAHCMTYAKWRLVFLRSWRILFSRLVVARLFTYRLLKKSALSFWSLFRTNRKWRGWKKSSYWADNVCTPGLWVRGALDPGASLWLRFSCVRKARQKKGTVVMHGPDFQLLDQTCWSKRNSLQLQAHFRCRSKRISHGWARAAIFRL